MPTNAESSFPPKDSSPDVELSDEMGSRWGRLLGVEEPEALDSGSIKAMAEDLDGNPSLVDFLGSKILSRPSHPNVHLLSKLYDQVTSKKVRKGIKRILYLLKQKGLEFPPEMEPKDRNTSSGILREMAPAQVFGYLSEFDETRSRMAAMVIPKGRQGKVLVFALVDPERNLESLTALDVNSKEARRILGELGEQAGHPFLKADPMQVAFILKEAHDRRSYLNPEDENLWSLTQNLLIQFKTIGHSPVIRKLFQQNPITEATSLDIHFLMELPEMIHYVLKPEAIEIHRQAIREVHDGILIVSQEQKRERLQAIVRKAASEISRGEEGLNLVRYLEEVAYIYYLKDEMKVAQVLFSAAQLLQGHSGAEDNPLWILLVEEALLLEKELDYGTQEHPKMEISQGGIILPFRINRE
jgi:hypothetical protein